MLSANLAQSAARSVSEPSDIDWAHYKAKLPELDVDAIKADYEKVLKSIPDIPYDEKADKVAHEAKEKVRAAHAKVAPLSRIFHAVRPNHHRCPPAPPLYSYSGLGWLRQVLPRQSGRAQSRRRRAGGPQTAPLVPSPPNLAAIPWAVRGFAQQSSRLMGQGTLGKCASLAVNGPHLIPMLQTLFPTTSSSLCIDTHASLDHAVHSI